MTVKILKTNTKLLCLCYNDDHLYIGDFMGNIFKAVKPYTNYCLIKNIDEPVSAIVIHKEILIYGTWKGNLFIDNQKIFLEEGIVKAIKSFDKSIFVAVNTSLYILSENKIQYKIDTTHKINVITVFNNTLYCGLNLPFIGTLKFYDNIPVFELVGVSHQAGITGIEFISDKMFTSSYDNTVMNYVNIMYKGNDWIRCMCMDVYGVGKQVICDNKLIYEHSDWVSAVQKIDDYIFSIGLDGVIMIYYKDLVKEFTDDDFENYMRD